jgi:D-lactate dehydrogenase
MDDLSRLIVERHDGSLKAEHGTGRNMAPFVELEWGAQATDLMWRLKRLFDPRGILNPGVILNDDPQVHTRNIKPMPPACELIDKCIECGYCEPTCPSRALTLTPRQRITVYREIARLRKAGEDPARRRELERAYQYQAIDTCAVDSLCAKACPVAIDTGRFVKGLRARRWGRIAPRVAAAIGKNFGAVAFIMRYGLGAADLMHRVLGTRVMSGLTGGARRLSRGLIPLWTPAMPGMGRTAPIPQAAVNARPRVVYFPSCASRAMGPARDDPERDPLSAKVISLFEKAGFQPVYPEAIGGMCCGQPFDSKGLNEEAGRKSAELERALLDASRGGKDPIVFDTSPCAFRIMKRRNPGLKIHDLPDFLHDEMLPKLTIVRREGAVAVHPTCSTLKLGTQAKLMALAEACAEEVVRPPEIRCCGWSGDRGFTLPELNASALRTLSTSLPEACAEGVSSSRTCEIGLSHHSGRPYRSIAYLLDRCSQARSD